MNERATSNENSKFTQTPWAYSSLFELIPESPTIKEAEEISTPEGMRRRIELYRMYCPLVQKCYDISMVCGSNELDRMTLIAFHALAENQRLKDLVIKRTQTTAQSSI